MKYELMLVASSSGNSESLLGRVQKLIEENNVEKVKVDSLGRKRLAYPIRKQTEADYYVVNFEAAPEVIKTISDKLKLEQEDLLRYLLIRQKIFREEEKTQVPKVEKVTVVTKKVGSKGSKKKTSIKQKRDLTKSRKKSKSK